MMGIAELTKKVAASSKKEDGSVRLQRLQKARIIDSKGYYSKKYFSEETCQKDTTPAKSISA